MYFWATKLLKMSEQKKLYRSNDKKICGVCGGIAEYFDMDPTIMRIIWIVGSVVIAGFPGLLAYLICALIMPQHP